MNYSIDVTNGNTPPHKHKKTEIIVFIGGNGFFCTNGKEVPVCAGKIIVVPPDTIHWSCVDTTLDRIYINGEFNQIFNLSSPGIISDNSQKEGISLAMMIYRNRYENVEYVSALCTAFAHFIIKNLKMEDDISMAVKKIIYEITENFHDCKINLSNILQQSSYAEDYIRAHFKRITGTTPTEFLTNIRIRHACYLIDVYRNSLSLSQIAEKCGYTDYIYFSRKFKQTMGIPPKQYRNELKI